MIIPCEWCREPLVKKWSAHSTHAKCTKFWQKSLYPPKPKKKMFKNIPTLKMI